jgi:hypothetical protein
MPKMVFIFIKYFNMSIIQSLPINEWNLFRKFQFNFS